MTVETTARKQSFAGGQTNLSFSFRASPDHPEEIKVNAVTGGTETLLTYLTQYTVDVEDDGVGGVVTLSPTYSTAYTHTVYRERAKTQASDYEDYNQFPADTLESDLDKRTMIEQEISEDIDRSLKVPISSTASVELPAPSPDKIFGWNTAATAIENKSQVVTSVGTTTILYLSNYADFATAISSISSTDTALIMDTAGAVDVDTTVPLNLSMIFYKKGILTIASGKTLTINGPIQAGLIQIFTGDGTVVFGTGVIGEVYPEWWKTNTSPGTTDMTTAVQAAVTAGDVRLSSKYVISTVISVPAARSIRGLGVTKTQVTASACDGFDLLGSNTELSDFSFYLSGRPYTNKAITSSGLYPANFAYMKFSRLLLDGWNIGIHLRDVWDALIEDVSTVYINNSFNLAGLCARVNFVNCFTNNNGTSATSSSVYLEYIGATATRPEGIKMLGCHFFGGAYGVYTTTGINTEVHISNCSFDVTKSAIQAQSGNNWIITNNAYMKASGSDPVINIPNNNTLLTSESVISNNTIYNSGSGKAIYIGQYSQNWVISNNIIRAGSSTYSIQVYSLARDIVIANNLFVTGTFRLPTIRVENLTRKIAVYNNQNVKMSYNKHNVFDCSFYNNTYQQKTSIGQAAPTSGTYNVGDTVLKEYISTSYTARGLSLGDIYGWICTKSGTVGTGAASASTTADSGKMTVAPTGQFNLGEYVTASTGFDSSTAPMQVVGISASTITLDTLARASVTYSSILHVSPTFSTMGQQGYRSGAVSPSAGTITPKFIGEEYLDSTANKWYKSYGATNADWAALN